MHKNQPLIQFSAVDFSYRGQQVFHNLSCDISENQFIALIGRNGAGKSTFLNLIFGLLQPDSGGITVQGQTAGSFQCRHWVGGALQDIAFPGSEKVEEIVHFVCHQFANSMEPQKLINDFALQDFRHKACSTLSGGMKRRLALACAFAGTPKVVLLDEPTTGLDKESRLRLISNIKSYQKKFSALVIMISHHPSEMAQSVDQYFLLKSSELKEIDPQKIKKLSAYRKVKFQSDSPPELERLKPLTSGFYQVITADSDQLIKDFCRNQVSFSNLEIHNLGAEEILQELT